MTIAKPTEELSAVTRDSLIAEVKEQIIRKWFDGAPKQIAGLRSRYAGWYETAEHNGVTLYTLPCAVMDRPAPYMPYQETDGMVWAFMKDGRLCHGFDSTDAKNDGPYQGTFEYFILNYMRDIDIEAAFGLMPPASGMKP